MINGRPVHDIQGRFDDDGNIIFENLAGTEIFRIPAGGGAGSVDWADITGKPATFAPTIGTTASTAVAGNDSRLTAGAAGTATVRAIGTTATTVVAGNDSRLTAGAAGVATVRALGTSATTAAAGTQGLTGAAGEVVDSVAADVAALVSDFNGLLVELRARGVIT